MTAFRRIVEDYETRLTPPAGGDRASPATGKAEWERFGDGDIQLEVSIRKLTVPDGTEVAIRLNGAAIGTAVVWGGRSSLRLSAASGHTIPPVGAGDRLEVARRAEVLLEGDFRPD